MSLTSREQRIYHALSYTTYKRHTDIAKELGVDSTTVSATVYDLRRKNLAKSRKCEKDGIRGAPLESIRLPIENECPRQERAAVATPKPFRKRKQSKASIDSVLTKVAAISQLLNEVVTDLEDLDRRCTIAEEIKAKLGEL